ncbi:MAG: hypothetical protein EBV03_11905, partial [Proteobacteria bacterium]|nr:hypothetical protein [Pseudomonadota bacterium]
MSDPNNPGLIPDPQQLFNLPQPNYNLLNSGNPALDLLFMQAVPQLLGIKADEFLPQLMPAQHVFDQMASYKYRMSTARNEEFARSKFGGASRSDDQAMFRTILNVRNQLSKDPVSSTQAVQLQGAAEMMNSQFGQNLIEMMVGPQMAEDIFFGSRGSKVRLARAVNQIGFSRRDTVTGKQSMSAESLEALTDNVFNNLYGDNADIDDVAGFSAGRVGDLMTGLARRGLLPQSAVNMNPEERRRVFKDKSLRTPGDKDFAAV